MANLTPKRAIHNLNPANPSDPLGVIDASDVIKAYQDAVALNNEVKQFGLDAANTNLLTGQIGFFGGYVQDGSLIADGTVTLTGTADKFVWLDNANTVQTGTVLPASVYPMLKVPYSGGNWQVPIDIRPSGMIGSGTPAVASQFAWTSTGQHSNYNVLGPYPIPLVAQGSGTIMAGDGRSFYPIENYTITGNNLYWNNETVNPGEPGLPASLEFFYSTTAVATGGDAGSFGGLPITDFVTTIPDHIEAVPTDPWLINHGANRYPVVVTVDPTGAVIEGQVTYVDANHIRIDWGVPVDGTARMT